MTKLITLENLSRFKVNSDNEYMKKQTIDTTPADGSENLITSGGVKEYVDKNMSGMVLTETDPTVPDYVKNIAREEKARWNIAVSVSNTAMGKVSELETAVATINTDITNLQNNKAGKDELPTATSQLTNDSGFITNEDVPTNLSQLTNDANFTTNDEMESYVDQSIESAIGGVSELLGNTDDLEV